MTDYLPLVRSETISPVLPEVPPNHFDPSQDLPAESIKLCYEKADAKLAADNCIELNLAKSDVRIPGQDWVLVSFVGESCNQKTDKLGLKVWGAFDSIPTAKAQADKLGKIPENSIYDIFILEMYSWAIIPPDKSCIDDQNYHEEKLHEIITEHKKQHLRAKEVFEARKEKLMHNPDINEFKKNKDALRALMDTPDSISGKPEIQNEEMYKSVFGEPLPLPKIEVLGDGEVLSQGQGLSESDADYKIRAAGVVKSIELGTDQVNEKYYSS